jgi:hypothetical protein
MVKIEELQLQEAASVAKSRLELWNSILRAIKVKAMVEVGVWKGDFAKELLERCDFIERYYMIDPWANLPDWNKPFNVKQQAFDEVYAEAMKKTAFATKKITVLRGKTANVIDKIADQSLDFVYIDGDHTLRGITIDLIQTLPKVKDGGFIGGDDFDHNPWQHDPRFEPTLVCPFAAYFAEAMNLPFVVLPLNQFLFQKRCGAKFSFIDTTGNYRDMSLKKLTAGAEKDGVANIARRALAKTGLIK